MMVDSAHLALAASTLTISATVFNRRHLDYLRRHWVEAPSRYVVDRWVLPRFGMKPMTIRNLCQKGWPTVAALTLPRADDEQVASIRWDRGQDSDGSDLLEEYARQSRALVLKDYVSPPKGGSWTLEWVRQVAGDSDVTIRVGDYQAELGDARMVPMRLGAFIDSLLGHSPFPGRKPTPGALLPYLGDAPLPLLDQYLAAPRFIGKAAGVARYWMGSSARTAMHCHQSYDFFVQQLVGRRSFILLPPHQALLAGFWPRNPNIAITAYDPFRTDPEHAEAMRYVRPIHVDLEPGDALLIPGFWFHAVEVAEQSLSAVISSENMPAAVGGGSRRAWQERPWSRGW
ncbi:MAG TPA: cupin-like domain-containing protein [Novosphingobium sp.]|nr:cupin-like domain-containing protein [Novosphingobium sp.]